MNKKKILIVTRNLPPLIGGMERLNWHIADELSHENEILLLSHKEAQNTAPQNCNFYGVRLNPLVLFLIAAFIKTFLICIVKKPDILFAGSGLTAPITVFWAKFFRKKSIVYIHGLDISNTSRVYKFLWLPFIRRSTQIIANSTPTKNLAIKNGIKESKIEIIHPGVSFPPPLKNLDLINDLNSRFALHNRKVLLSVGRLTERKGILEFVKYCLPSIVNAELRATLVVIGDTANHALNNKFQTQDQILKIAKQYNVDENIVFTGAISDEELSQFFYLADVHVFPVKHIPDDPEGFGMVAIEAAAHGTPTVAFATGGVIDAIKNEETGYLVENYNFKQFSDKTICILNRIDIQWNMTDIIEDNFSWKIFSIKLNKVM